MQSSSSPSVRLLIQPEPQAAAEPAPGTLARVVAEGWIDAQPFPIALAQLAKWQCSLRVGGELVVRTKCPWAIDRLRRALIGIGFRIDRSASRIEGDTHTTTVWAVQTTAPDLERSQRVLEAMLAETYAPREADAAWHAVQRELATIPTERHSRILPKSTAAPTVSIVMLTYNAIADTKKCLASLEAFTKTAYELIVVDNASSDGTPEFLRAYAADRANVTVIFNEQNKGFAAGNNQGFAIARGEYVMMLNNDTVVTAGWLERMIAVCEERPEIAIVGPRSNCVSGAQLVSHAPYQSEAQMHAFAERFTSEHAGQTERAIRLVGFCMLVRKQLIDEIGGLDERFGRGNFEDDDFCLRAAARGYEARIAGDVFIHHTGSQSFKAANIDYRAALETNWRIFKAKWGIPMERTLEDGYPSQLSPPEQAMQFIQLPDISITPTVDEPIFTVAPVTAPQLGGANEHATAASPDVSAQPTKTELERLFDDAEAAAQRGDWASSLTLFDEMVRRHPTFGPGYVGLASAAFATGQVQAGAVALEHACGIYPDNADLRTQLGVALAHSGRLQEAQAKFLEVLDIDAKNIDAIVSLAHLCRASRNFVEAVDLLDHAEQLAPKSPLVLGAIGATALELGDRAGAETTLAHLRTVAPDHAETQHLAASIAAFGG